MTTEVLEALSTVSELLSDVHAVLAKLEISQPKLIAAYDELREAEKKLWEAKRLLSRSGIDRVSLYEVQDILTNADSDASFPSVFAALRTIHRLAGREDDGVRDRMDAATEKTMLLGIGMILDRIKEIEDRL